MEYLKQTGVHSHQLRAPLNGIPQTHKRMMRKRRWQRLSSFISRVHFHLPIPAFFFPAIAEQAAVCWATRMHNRWQACQMDTRTARAKQVCIGPHGFTMFSLGRRLSSFVFEVHYHIPTLPAFVFITSHRGTSCPVLDHKDAQPVANM